MSPTHTQSSSATTRKSGEASGKKTGLHQPNNDREISDKLDNVDLDSQGEKVHDHLRDKRGKGVAGDYDDSINHDADERYSQENSAKRPAK